MKNYINSSDISRAWDLSARPWAMHRAVHPLNAYLFIFFGKETAVSLTSRALASHLDSRPQRPQAIIRSDSEFPQRNSHENNK